MVTDPPPSYNNFLPSFENLALFVEFKISNLAFSSNPPSISSSILTRVSDSLLIPEPLDIPLYAIGSSSLDSAAG